MAMFQFTKNVYALARARALTWWLFIPLCHVIKLGVTWLLPIPWWLDHFLVTLILHPSSMIEAGYLPL